MTENTDANLVASAVRGDAESFGRLCERHYAALVAVAYSHLADRNLAEDAAQEALLAAFCGVAELKETDRFATWLTAICRNIAIDMAKRRTREGRAGSDHRNSIPNAGRTENDTAGVVRDIIFSLRPGEREVVFLRYYNDLTYKEIATMLEISEEAVNGKLRRARARIRRKLQRRASTETEP